MKHPDPSFREVRDQIKLENITILATSIRHSTVNIPTQDTSTADTMVAPFISCELVDPPLSGSYNITYSVLFDDGVKWIFKVPRNGHRRCFDTLSSQALTSEALTMRLVQRETKVPVPIVHGFDTTMENPIGCPYILMDFAQGKPLYQVWFGDKDQSLAALQQVRSRALHGIASAMAELTRLRVQQGGALCFDDTEKEFTVGPARSFDAVTMLERRRAAKAAPQNDDCGRCDDAFCAIGPCEEPIDSILFGLDQRSSRMKLETDEKGLDECLRLYTQWALEHLEANNNGEPRFAFAHPDLDSQNIFLLEDGSLSAIIDWDGVVPVPLSVGSLRYPSFLMRDWEPTYYQWDVEKDEPVKNATRDENSPEELEIYRTMYAQLLEMALSYQSSTAAQSKQLALMTRTSVVLGSLGWAANNHTLIPGVVTNIFDEMESIAECYADIQESKNSRDTSSGTASQSSCSSETSTDISETRSETSDEDTEEEDDADDPDKKYHNIDKEGEELGEQDAIDLVTIGGNFNGDLSTMGCEFRCHRCAVAADVTAFLARRTHVEPNCSLRDGAVTPIVDSAASRPPTNGISRKAKIATYALDIGGRSCKGLARIFYHREQLEATSEQSYPKDPGRSGIGDQMNSFKMANAAEPIVRALIDAEGKPIPLNEPCPYGSKHNFHALCRKDRLPVEPLLLETTEVGKKEQAVDDMNISEPYSPERRFSASSQEAKSSNTSSTSQCLRDLFAPQTPGTDVPQGNQDGDDIPEARQKDICQDKHDNDQPTQLRIVSVPDPQMLQPDRSADLKEPSKDDEEEEAAGADDANKDDDVVDNGGFTIEEICVALGKGELDRERLDRLKEGFMCLLGFLQGKW